MVLDVDATIVVAHSEKELASPTFKRTFGFHPLGVWCDNTTEFLTAKLRTGRAGSNTAADHIEVLADAIAQVPGAHRKDLLIRSDGAGASHQLLDWLTDQGRSRGRKVEYSVRFAITEKIRDAIARVPKTVWATATDADGAVREGSDVSELTGLVDLSAWPSGMRVIVRRERPHPGAQLSLFEERDGWRYQAFVTNTTAPDAGVVALGGRDRRGLRQHRRDPTTGLTAVPTTSRPGEPQPGSASRPASYPRTPHDPPHAVAACRASS